MTPDPERVRAAARELLELLDTLPCVGVSNLLRPAASDAQGDAEGDDK